MPEPEFPLSPEREAQILDGAAAVFSRDGYEGASMSRIACEAGVAKGSLYNYFENKAALFAAYVRRECGRSLLTVFEDVENETDMAVALRTIGMRMQRLMFSPVGLATYRVVMAEAAKFPDLARGFYAAGPAVAIGRLAIWLHAQRDAGRLRMPDPEFAAEQFYALCRTRYGLLRELQLLTELPAQGVEHVVDEAVRLFLGYYAHRG